MAICSPEVISQKPVLGTQNIESMTGYLLTHCKPAGAKTTEHAPTRRGRAGPVQTPLMPWCGVPAVRRASSIRPALSALGLRRVWLHPFGARA